MPKRVKPKSAKQKAGSSQRANSRRRVTETARQAQALQMRLTGATYEQIGMAMGVHKSSAWKLVEHAMERTIQEPADNVRALEVRRLDRWLFAINTQILAGQLEFLDRGLKIMARRAALLGLDMPVKVAPTTPDGLETYQPQIVWLPSKAPSPEAWAAELPHQPLAEA